MKKSLWMMAAISCGLMAAHAQTPPTNQPEELLGDVVVSHALPTTFNYQALITEKGAVVKEKELKIKITLRDENKVYFSEEHTAKTSATGLVDLQVGAGTPLLGTLPDVAWDKGIFIAIETDFGAGYKSLGAPVKMMAAPYAQCALSAPVIRGNGLDKDQPIFQVQNADGLPVFSVYEDAVSINVAEDEEGTRRPRGGFAVRSFRAEGMRGDTKKYESVDRLQLVDGAFKAYIDPDDQTRRPRGGFAVMTRNHFRGEGDGKDSVVLMNLSERETFFTLDKEDPTNAFEIRNRCDANEVVLAFASDGKIATKQEKNEAIVKVDNTPGKQLAVTWPVTDNPFAGPSDDLFFSTFMRWRTPKVMVDNSEISYKIEIIDGDGAKLSDYVVPGYILGDHNQKVYGLMLKPGIDAHGAKFTIPEGKIKITGLANKNLTRTQDFRYTRVEDTINFQINRVTMNLADREVFADLECLYKKGTIITRYSEFLNNQTLTIRPRTKEELLHNENPNYVAVMDGAIALTLKGDKVGIRVLDPKKFEEALGPFPAGHAIAVIPIRITAPEGVLAKGPNGNIYYDIQLNIMVKQ